MSVWMPVVAWGVVRLVRALIDWRARICYERARAASVIDVLRSVPAGVTVRESHADGTMLFIVTPAISNSFQGADETTRRKPC